MNRIWLNRIIAIVLVIGMAVAGVYVGIKLKEMIQDNAPAKQIEGLHNVRTGELEEDALTALRHDGEQIMFYYVVYFDPLCPPCEEHVPQVIKAWAHLVATQWGHKFGVVMIDVTGASDEELVAWAARHKVPQDIPVLAGINENQIGLPLGDLTVDPDADMTFRGTPRTFVQYRNSYGWRTKGSRPGAQPASDMMELAISYFRWADAEGIEP